MAGPKLRKMIDGTSVAYCRAAHAQKPGVSDSHGRRGEPEGDGRRIQLAARLTSVTRVLPHLRQRQRLQRACGLGEIDQAVVIID
jgi:hypothetical protein